jgi:DNA helicase II / ATP-dependent DNA helicase PcrA
VLVDEWQDTSTLQYEIAKGLCSVNKCLFIVGDPDQSIYSWRFARMENIFKFRKDFEGAAVVKLEMNYRSAGNILSLAHKLISQDKKVHSRIFSHSLSHF